MNRNAHVRKLLKILLVLIGAGIGLWLSEQLQSVFHRLFPETQISASVSYMIHAGAMLAGGILLFLFREKIINFIWKIAAILENRWDKMPGRQIFLRAAGIVAGLLMAFLCTQLILSAGATILTVSLSALIYVLFGYLGMRLGDRCFRRKIKRNIQNFPHRFLRKKNVPDSGDIQKILDEIIPEAETAHSLYTLPALPKVLDSSVLIDGRLLALYRIGILEGKLVVPSFVLAELQRLSDSADSIRRARGKRGLDQLGVLREAGAPVEVPEYSLSGEETVDTALLHFTKECGGLCVTNDTNLCKAAQVIGVKTLNLFELFNSLRFTLSAGDMVTADITREGKEPGQGVAYLEDGTMLVVEGANSLVGSKVSAVVTSVLQTSAGRMVFARMEAQES